MTPVVPAPAPGPDASGRPLTAWIAATRPGFLLVSALAALVGVASAWACGALGSRIDALASVVLVVLAHAAINLHNDWGDALIGSDADNTERITPFTGGSRAVQDGRFTAAQLREAVHLLAIVVIGGGVLLVARSGLGLLGIGLAGLLIGWAYSMPRWGLMLCGLGELGVGAAWWLIVVGADYVQRHQFSTMPAVAGVSVALLVTAVLWIAEFPDARSDARVGKRTAVVRLGPELSALVYTALVVWAHSWVAWWWSELWLPTEAWWALGSAPLSLGAVVLLWRHLHQPSRLRGALVLTLLAALMHAALLALAFGAVVARR